MNALLRKLKFRPARLAKTVSSSNCKVEPNAAYSPSEMQKLAARGIAISSAAVNEQLFFDGFDTPPDVPPVDNLRGVDVVDCWENQIESRRKILGANKRELEILGPSVTDSSK